MGWCHEYCSNSSIHREQNAYMLSQKTAFTSQTAVTFRGEGRVERLARCRLRVESENDKVASLCSNLA